MFQLTSIDEGAFFAPSQEKYISGPYVLPEGRLLLFCFSRAG